MRTAASNKSPSFQPLYMQIKALLMASLDDGEWPPGEAIPSEMALAQRFRVSQGTVRKAIDALAAQSIVIRRQGKVTFVSMRTEARCTVFSKHSSACACSRRRRSCEP